MGREAPPGRRGTRPWCPSSRPPKTRPTGARRWRPCAGARPLSGRRSPGEGRPGASGPSSRRRRRPGAFRGAGRARTATSPDPPPPAQWLSRARLLPPVKASLLCRPQSLLQSQPLFCLRGSSFRLLLWRKRLTGRKGCGRANFREHEPCWLQARARAWLASISAREVLHGPDLAGGCREETARDLVDGRAGHVDEVPVLLKALTGAGIHRRWPLVPHLLKAQADDLVVRAIAGARVLTATGLADLVAVAGVRLVLFRVVLSHFVRAGLAVGPASQGGQTRALGAELIDAIDTVLMKVAGGRGRLQLAREVLDATAGARAGSTAPCTRFLRRAPGAAALAAYGGAAAASAASVASTAAASTTARAARGSAAARAATDAAAHRRARAVPAGGGRAASGSSVCDSARSSAAARGSSGCAARGRGTC